MFKKIIASAAFGIMFSIGIPCVTSPVDMAVAYAARPATDTWVMEWDGDLYVKAGTLKRIGHPEAAPNFDVMIIRVRPDGSTKEYRCEFRAKGDVKLTVNGAYHSMGSQNYRTKQLYDSLCRL